MIPTARAFMRATCIRRTASKTIPRIGDKVIVAMSGGVDSSVTASLLAEQDYDLSAVFMRNWDTRDESGTDRGCEWEKDWEDVQRVCKTLDIPCQMVDLSREYWLRVFEPSLKAWEAGDTPNPDIWCNREVKFGALMDALPKDTDFLATGHYAQKNIHPHNHRPMLSRAADRNKDQTYYLSSITERMLARALFPLGGLQKADVRRLARAAGLHNAEREESMGICFVGEKRKFTDFLGDYIPPRPGPIRELDTGRTLGEHHGLWTYTVGQGAKIKGMPQRMFVVRKDKARNEIWVAPSTHADLLAAGVRVRDWSWIWENGAPAALDAPDGLHARMQFRHRMAEAGCIVRKGSVENELTITFDEPQKAVALGQTAAIWSDDVCLGCGTIVDVDPMPRQ